MSILLRRLCASSNHVHSFQNTIKSSKRVFMRKANQNEFNTVNSSGIIRLLIKPFVYTVGFCGMTTVCASIWQYESVRLKFKWKNNNYWQNWNGRVKAGEWRNQIYLKWNSFPDSVKIFSSILIINGLVFLAWRVPSFNPFLIKYFTSTANAKSLQFLPMVLSNFSHASFLHITLNMFVLFSFTLAAAPALGKEQFLALYLNSGIASSFLSYAHKLATKSPVSSLGASGAILGILSYTCITRPDIQLTVILLPFIVIPAGMALKGIVLLDLAGVVLKWKLFDHAAHLGGAFFGIWYATYGQQLMWDKRGYIVKKWHQIRNQ